jgi:allophanate hydrolase subunit 2
MDKGETIMPTPEGIISTSTGAVDTTAVELAEELLEVKDDEVLIEVIERVEETKAEVEE